MIIVLIIGILLAIAIPNFLQARENSRKQSCINNLRLIESAKDKWAESHPSNAVTTGDLMPQYLTKMPECPSGGTYTIGAVGERPTCSIEGHVLP
jgi:competence protein ComGC